MRFSESEVREIGYLLGIHGHAEHITLQPGQPNHFLFFSCISRSVMLLLQLRFREHTHLGSHKLFKPPLGHTNPCLLPVFPHSTIVHVLQNLVTMRPSERKKIGTACLCSKRSLRRIQNADIHWRAQCVATPLYSPPSSGPFPYLAAQSLRCDSTLIGKHTSSSCCQRQPLRTLPFYLCCPGGQE